MKICTACDATYGDETIFCPVDGTTLTPEKNLSFDQVPFPYSTGNWIEPEDPAKGSDPQGYSTNPELPPTAAASFSQPPPYVPQSFSPPSPASNSNRGSIYAIAVAGAVILGFAGFLMIATQNRTSGVYNGPAQTNSAVIVTSSNRAVVTNSAPANSAGISETIKPLSRKTDLTGIWKGKFNGVPATFNITSHKGETFSGTLSKNGYLVEFVGGLNYEKATVSIKETKVLKTPPNSIWNLGVDNGTVYENGMVMRGTGSDKNGSYDWSFTKE